MNSNTKEPEKDIVSFDQALELCSLGFDEPTFCMYEIENRQLCLCHIDEEGLYMPDKDLHAPTKSQVFRWFREKYHDVLVKDYGLIPHFTMIQNMFLDSNKIWIYEEAESQCINKLIEIAKQQDHDRR